MAREFIEVVSHMSDITFAEVVQASPRKIRETLFGRLGIKAKRKGVSLKIHEKSEERTRRLHERLRGSTTTQENDLCGELVRNWLYTKRSLLKDTLDYLGIKNEEGLIEEEPLFFQELSEEKVKALVEHLKTLHAPEAIRIYLAFVKTPHLEAAGL